MYCNSSWITLLETPYDRYMFAYCSPYAIKERIKYLYDRYLTAIGRAKYKRTYEQLFNRENIKYITVSNHSKYSLLSFFPLWCRIQFECSIVRLWRCLYLLQWRGLVNIIWWRVEIDGQRIQFGPLLLLIRFFRTSYSRGKSCYYGNRLSEIVL